MTEIFGNRSSRAFAGITSIFCAAVFSFSGISQADPTFDRASWTHWHGEWNPAMAEGNFGPANFFGDAPQQMTCVCTDGSVGGPDYWAAGTGSAAAQDAYKPCIDWVSVADRNPAYMTVECGY